MADFNDGVWRQYFDYVYTTAVCKYGDCSELDVIVQNTLLAFVEKISQGTVIEYPKGWLDRVLRNKHNE